MASHVFQFLEIHWYSDQRLFIRAVSIVLELLDSNHCRRLIYGFWYGIYTSHHYLFMEEALRDSILIISRFIAYVPCLCFLRIYSWYRREDKLTFLRLCFSWWLRCNLGTPCSSWSSPSGEGFRCCGFLFILLSFGFLCVWIFPFLVVTVHRQQLLRFEQPHLLHQFLQVPQHLQLPRRLLLVRQALIIFPMQRQFPHPAPAVNLHLRLRQHVLFQHLHPLQYHQGTKDTD